jgi:glycosyltransferase involved in cell wall biosynthesis
MYPDTLPGISAVLATHDRDIDLDSTVLELAAVLDGLVSGNFEIIVVDSIDDSATRHTGEILAGLRARCPGLPLRILDQQNAQRGVALAAGFDAARSDLIFVTAADGQFDVRELNHLLDAIELGADFAIGLRRRRSRAWSRFVNMLAGGKAWRDVDCAFTLIRRAVWQGVGPVCCSELLVRARQQGFRVAEVSVSPHPVRDAAGSLARSLAVGRHAA